MFVDHHLMASTGAPKEEGVKFDAYCTSYEMGHGHHGLNPRSPPRQKDTGYSSNFRPGVYYRPELDQMDNPSFVPVIAEAHSRKTMMQNHYPPLIPGDDGRSAPPVLVPSDVPHNMSAFGKQGAPYTLPLESEGRRYYATERSRGSFTIPVKTDDHLKTLTVRRDPVESENSHHGPAYMSTEMGTRYQGRPTGRMNVNQKSVGKYTESGWTKSQNLEPVTFRADDPFSTLTARRQYETRPIGRSTFKTDYITPGPRIRGTEDMPALQLAGNEYHDTGFTRGGDTSANLQRRRTRSAYEPLDTLPSFTQERMKKDPAALMNSTFPSNDSSVMKNCYEGLPELARMDRHIGVAPTISRLETSGDVWNNEKYLAPGHEPQAFYTTQYATRFYDKNPTGVERQGFVGGNALPGVWDAFSKSNRVHSNVNGPERDNQKQLSTVHPYVARSIMKRDPFFLSDPHAHKVKA
eukprot:scpid58641/ scgid22271/ Protein phosphatase 1 regulatory subunit 32; Protein IIIG9